MAKTICNNAPYYEVYMNKKTLNRNEFKVLHLKKEGAYVNFNSQVCNHIFGPFDNVMESWKGSVEAMCDS